MRLLFIALVALVGLIQYPLWIGKGGWLRVWELQTEVAQQRDVNEGLRARNAALAAEVDDLKTGTGALEERARGDLGMMREGEVFVHILPHDQPAPQGIIPLISGSKAAPTHKPASGTPSANTQKPAAR